MVIPMVPMRFVIWLITVPVIAFGPARVFQAVEQRINAKQGQVTQHWAFQPIRKPQPPDDPANSSKHPIDQFITARYRLKGIAPIGVTDRRTLLRRVTFDLIGLPPTPEEIRDYLADESPDAFARVVERLLAS